MSVAAALQDMFSVPELTVPVQLGDASARGLLDEAGEILGAGDAPVQRIGIVLYLPKGALAGLTVEDVVTIGSLGAATAAGGVTRTVHAIDPMQDGLVLACQIGGGR